MASFTKEVNLRLAKRSLKINGRLANRWWALLQRPQDVNNYQDDITGRSVSGVTQPNAAHSRIHVYVPDMVISLEFIGGSVKIGLISLAKDDHVSLAKDAIGCNTFNTLRPRQHGRHFPDDIFKCIFLNENVWTSTQISLKFVPKGPIDNIPALVQIMAWRRPGDKPLSEPMLII